MISIPDTNGWDIITIDQSIAAAALRAGNEPSAVGVSIMARRVGDEPVYIFGRGTDWVAAMLDLKNKAYEAERALAAGTYENEVAL